MNIFDIVNNISNSRSQLEFTDEIDKLYSQYLINLAFSYYSDTVLIADELNKHKTLTNQQHYEIMFNIISKRKRFSKWVKQKKHGDVNLISEYYNISNRKALEIIRFFSDSDLNGIKLKLDKGGMK